jgi:cellulose biosynthesis protein BcsQ
MLVLAFLNQKGGVSKTTLATNVATALALQKQKMLCRSFSRQRPTCDEAGISPLEDNSCDAFFSSLLLVSSCLQMRHHKDVVHEIYQFQFEAKANPRSLRYLPSSSHLLPFARLSIELIQKVDYLQHRTAHIRADSSVCRRFGIKPGF